MTDLHDYGQLVLGVDGGGTKTLARLADCHAAERPATIGCGTAGPSNPQAVGMETARQNISNAIEGAFADARRPFAPVAAACLALAGVGRESIRLDMLRWAQSVSLAQHVQVVHDAHAVLAAGTADGTGIAAICGTGSFAFGTDSRGKNARSGGWGYLLGDEGSGYAIGCAALRAVTRAADGRGPGTSLTELVLDAMHLTEPPEVIPAIYNAPSPRFRIASLASCVFRAADEGDDVAEQIRRDAAIELGHLVRGVAHQLGYVHRHYDLALAGGVIVKQPSWTTLIVKSLADPNCSPRAVNVVEHPVSGAVLLASRTQFT